jgi:ribose 1,5-bisphosphokinase PhnN
MNPRTESLLSMIADARSLHLSSPEGPPFPQRIDAVVIVGSTCAGKTTICNALRRSAMVRDGLLAVPPRFLTRPARRHDQPVESIHLSQAEFEDKVVRGDIASCWTRQLESGRWVRYGFPSIEPGRLPVYSGNNALLPRAPGQAAHALAEHALLIGVCAPDPVRARRLQIRSPDLVEERPEEVACRLADSSSSVLGHVHVVVENHGDLEAAAPQEVAGLVGLISVDGR